jgi:hypothetical protein
MQTIHRAIKIIKKSLAGSPNRWHSSHVFRRLFWGEHQPFATIRSRGAEFFWGDEVPEKHSGCNAMPARRRLRGGNMICGRRPAWIEKLVSAGPTLRWPPCAVRVSAPPAANSEQFEFFRPPPSIPHVARQRARTRPADTPALEAELPSQVRTEAGASARGGEKKTGGDHWSDRRPIPHFFGREF